jgi:hypothetical protein
MNLRDYIGQRGENIFRVLITQWCDGRPWFSEVFLGDKHEAKDFAVNLIGSSVDACFYVQVKATLQGYTGAGRNRKLRVSVSKRDVEKLKKAPGPAFVVGIDVASDRRGYITAITAAHTKGIVGVPTKHRLNCRTIKALWKEVGDYWKSRPMTRHRSRF